jgi:hypothetical protein
MRTLNFKELEYVSGGDWSLGFDLGVIDGTLSGTETVQEIAGSIANGVSVAYGGAVGAMANFFTWWDPAGYYSSGCSGGGGR